jgi:hypothetical protein
MQPKPKPARKSIFGAAGRPKPVNQALPMHTFFVPQAYGAIVARNSPGCNALGTTGLASCLGVVLYTSSHVYVGHFDSMTPNVGFDCADAAVDRMRELNDGMDVECVLVNWGSSAALCAEVEAAMQRRAVNCQKPSARSVCADFFVNCHSPGTINPCLDPGNVHNGGNFDAVRQVTDGNSIYRLRNDTPSLHFKATQYHDHNWN